MVMIVAIMLVLMMLLALVLAFGDRSGLYKY